LYIYIHTYSVYKLTNHWEKWFSCYTPSTDKHIFVASCWYLFTKR